jgi:uncharacterized protein involved in exopolysaccharide biosynthesis
MIDDRTEGERGENSSPAGGPGAMALRLSDVIGVIIRRKLLIGAMTIAMAGAGVLAGYVISPKFLATAQIYIDPHNLQVIRNDITSNSVDAAAFTGVVESQALIVLSDKVMRPAVNSLRLYEDPLFAGKDAVPPGTQASSDTAKAMDDARKAAVETLKKMTTVRRPERTSILEITVANRTAAGAADLANAVANSYLELLQSNGAQLAFKTSGLLNERLDAMRRDVREAESRVQAFKSSNNLLGTDKVLVTESQLADINMQLGSARAKVAEAKARFEQIEAARRSPELLGALPEAVGSNTIGNLRIQDVEARRQLASLQAVLGDAHPSVRAAVAQAENVRRAVEAELARIAASALAELQRSREAEVAITKTVDGLKSQVADAGKASVELRELEREAEASKSIYEAFLNRARETGELANVDISNASIVTAAIPPVGRSFPPRTIVLAIAGALAGGAIGFGLAVLIDLIIPRLFVEEGGAPSHFKGAPRLVTPSPTLKSVAIAPAPKPAAGPAERGLRYVSLPALPRGQRVGQSGRQLDLAGLGFPLFDRSLPEHDALLCDILDDLALATTRPACLVVAGPNAAGERTTLTLSLALAAVARGFEAAVLDLDRDKRTLTRAAMAGLAGLSWDVSSKAARTLYHGTANGIGLVLAPSGTALSQLDPVEVVGAVFEANEDLNLLVCDGPVDPMAISRAARRVEADLAIVVVSDSWRPPNLL